MFMILPDQGQLVDIIKKFDGLTERIDGMPAEMDQQFSQWQSDDVNRSAPRRAWTGPLSMLTTFFARSPEYIQRKRSRARQAYNVAGHQKARRTGRFWWNEHRRRGQRLPRGRQHVISSRRPVVRPELMDDLVTRMRELMERTMEWGRR